MGPFALKKPVYGVLKALGVSFSSPAFTCLGWCLSPSSSPLCVPTPPALPSGGICLLPSCGHQFGRLPVCPTCQEGNGLCPQRTCLLLIRRTRQLQGGHPRTKLSALRGGFELPDFLVGEGHLRESLTPLYTPTSSTSSDADVLASRENS